MRSKGSIGGGSEVKKIKFMKIREDG